MSCLYTEEVESEEGEEVTHHDAQQIIWCLQFLCGSAMMGSGALIVLAVKS